MGRLGHRPALDGVRGIAIAGVVGYHLFNWPRHGGYGVDLFFVLSGFLITTLLLEEHARTGRISLGNFYRRRARRLLPALGVMFGFYVFLELVNGVLFEKLLGLLATFSYLANFLQAWPQPSLLIPGTLHLWSLATEEQFYVIWPTLLVVLLALRASSSRIAAVLLVVFAAVTAHRLLLAGTVPDSRLSWAPDTRGVDGIAIGCLTAVAFVAGRLPKIPLLGLASLVAVTGFIIAGPDPWELWLIVFELAAACLIISILNGNVSARLLAFPRSPTSAGFPTRSTFGTRCT